MGASAFTRMVRSGDLTAESGASQAEGKACVKDLGRQTWHALGSGGRPVWLKGRVRFPCHHEYTWTGTGSYQPQGLLYSNIQLLA